MTDSLESRKNAPHKSAAEPAATTRIDRAHVAQTTLEKPAVPAVEWVAAAAGMSPAHAPEQLQRQAGQLADVLRRRVRELDHRESQLNAQMAQFESQSRAARLLLQDRILELDRQQAECETRLRDALERQHRAESEAVGRSGRTAVELDRISAALAEREIRVEAEENRLRLAAQQMQARRESSMQLVRQLMRSVERRRQAVEDSAAQAAAPTG
ncbi:MAG: hypothetical protein KDA41_22815 [Planctomycetales bacterium]|nr:hypothetical protein [Planctomycetales bacterium]